MKARQPPAPVDPPRRTAYDTLVAVHRDGAYANLALPRLLTERGLTGRDAAFATELTYGTLRLQGTLDAVLAAAARRPVERIDPPTRDALRLGAYQVLRTRVAPHAAVSTTVDLVATVAPRAAGFANAVLRAVAGRSWDDWVTDLAPADPVEKLALAHAHPAWIVRAFAEALGGDLSEVELALAADNEPAPVHLCARPGVTTVDELARMSGGTPGRFSPYAVHMPAGAPADLPALRPTTTDVPQAAHVQDEGSQVVTTALADAALVDGPDREWIDLCAGPGGKAALLGALAQQRGARLMAVEVAPHRAELVRLTTRGLPVQVVCADGRETAQIAAPATMDRVLVDAPCTGLGALRRRPDARWRRSPSDLAALTALQRDLLAAAVRLVRPGGVVAYVTCSPHRSETELSVSQTRRRLRGTAIDVDLLDAREYLPPGMSTPGDGPTVQLWPHRHGTDAMYLALLRRVMPTPSARSTTVAP